uniref:Germinal-center associated nuclear protein n=1 Tax=Phlebotomus papatasi TaxID=29031 RepID=A0A1B0DJT6_PHLPP
MEEPELNHPSTGIVESKHDGFRQKSRHLHRKVEREVPRKDRASSHARSHPKIPNCEQIPEQFLDKTIAKEHFGQFGPIRRFILRPKRFACQVDYETTDAAENALMDGGVFNNHEFRIFFTPKEAPKSKLLDEYVDPDVQAELEAMGTVPMAKISSPRQSISEVLRDKIERRTKFGQKADPGVKVAPASALPAVNPTTRAEIEATLDIKKAEATKGICPDMCPEKERLMRQAKKQVASFEMDQRGNLKHHLAVKQYSRSSADQESALPHELRPEPVLRMTMNYLLHNIVNLCDVAETNMSDWFHFLWDRTRSIRKDITQQELCSQDSVVLVEQCARFHIHCSARLIAEDPSVFDQKINTENLTKCLQSLKYMYHDLALKGEMCPNEAEFRGYIILLNLQDSNFLWEIKQLPESVQRSEEVRFAIEVFLAMESNNYVKFFQLVRKTSYMNACILLRYFIQVRARALEVIVKAYTVRGPVVFSLRHLMYILAFEDAESTVQFAEYYGLQSSQDDDEVILNKNSFYHPDMPFLLDRAINVVEHKRICSVGEAISKSALEPRESFEKHQPHDSFDEKGFLTEDAWAALDIAKKPKLMRDEIDTTMDNIFKIPSGSPPISPKNANSAFSRTSFAPFQPRVDSPKFSLAQKIHQEETTPPRFQLQEPKSVFASLIPISSSPASPGTGQVKPIQRTQPFSLNFKAASDIRAPISNIFGGAASAFTSVASHPPPDGFFGAGAKKAQAEEQERLKREQEEKERKRKEREEELRKMKEEEDELRAQRAKLEEQVMKARKIDRISKETFDEILQEVAEEECEKAAEEEIELYRVIQENIEEVSQQIIEEVTDELAERIVCEEYIVKRSRLVRDIRKLSKCFNAWRQFTLEKINRRNIINNTPIWLPTETLEKQVENFRHPHQDATIELRSRYLRGIPDELNLSRKPTNAIDIFGEIGQMVLGRVRKVKERGILRSHHYWKVLVSIPDEGEETVGFTGYISKWLEEIFQRTIDKKDKNILFLEQNHVKNCQEILAVSVETLRGIGHFRENGKKFDVSRDTFHGIVFVLTVGNFENSRKRLSKLLSTNPEIPISIIVYNGHSVTHEEVKSILQVNPALNLLKIYDENRRKCKESLGKIFEDGLKFCAENYNYSQNLEMGRTWVVLDETLGSVLWRRLHLSAQINPKLSAISHNINFVITLYNNAVKAIRRFAQEDTFEDYPDFPEEFRQFVPRHLGESFITCENFPKDWRNRNRLRILYDFLSKLILPPFTFSGKVFNSRDIERELRKYLGEFLPPESLNRVTYGIMEPILATEINESISWLRPIEVIALERLTVGFRETELPQEMVYERVSLEDYRTRPWWLTDDLLGGVSVELDEEPEMKKRKQEKPLNLDDVLQAADKSIKKANEKLQKCQTIVSASCAISRELDTKLMKQEENNRQINRIFRERFSQ